MFSLFSHTRENEGSVLIIALLVLALSTITGIVVAKMTMNEIRSSSNITYHKMAFYAAESARNYVAGRPDLYDSNNMDPTAPLQFQSPDGLLGQKQSFDGSVQYLGMSEVPRGSGFEIGSFKAYRYKMICNGYGPSEAKSHIEVGFYRVGY